MRVAVVQMQGDGDIARRCAVQVVVDVGAALPGEAERRVVQQRFNVAGATGQRQRAGVVAGNRNRLAAGGAVMVTVTGVPKAADSVSCTTILPPIKLA